MRDGRIEKLFNALQVARLRQNPHQLGDDGFHRHRVRLQNAGQLGGARANLINRDVAALVRYLRGDDDGLALRAPCVDGLKEVLLLIAGQTAHAEALDHQRVVFVQQQAQHGGIHARNQAQHKHTGVEPVIECGQTGRALAADVVQDAPLAKQRQLGVVDGGKGVHRLGVRLAGARAADHAAVEHQHHAKERLILRGKKGVKEIAPRVGVLLIDGALGAGQHDGLGAVLNEVGERAGGIGHGVRAVRDDEAVVAEVVVLHASGDGQPVLGRHVGGVDVEKLHRVDAAQSAQRGHAGEDVLGA